VVADEQVKKQAKLVQGMPETGLSIQFRLAYNNYRTDYDFEAYRDLHGYDFETATKDFYDVRLYLDYMF
jgi:hypothetical protein